MAELKKVLGQKHIVSHFENAIKTDKVTHAYILSGDAYFGKKHLANRYAMAINCEEHTGEPCLKCKSCKLALSDNHPDIITVTSEKEDKAIGVNEIRNQVNNTVSIKPYYKRKKIYIIPNAQKMNSFAQNALLKTLEEPPEYVVIMLLTTNSASFLQTILSRAVVLDMRPVEEKVIKEYLKTEYGLGDYDAGVAANFADGNPGKAKKAVTEEFIALRDQVVKSITTVVGGDMRDIKLATNEAKTYKNDMNDYFGLVRMWLRDMLIYKSTGDKSRLVFKGEFNNIRDYCEGTGYESINTVLKKLDYVIGLLASNVNFDASIELLFMAFNEEIKLKEEY